MLQAIPVLSHAFTDTAAQVIMTHIEAVLGHGIEIISTIRGVVHGTQILHTGAIAIDPAVTHHINHTTDHPHKVAHHSTPEIEATHIHAHPINHQNEIHISHPHTPVDHKTSHITRRTPE